MRTKYYFITYQGTNNQGSVSVWSDVSDVSPMEFIKNIQLLEEVGSGTYNNLVVINTCEISSTEFNKYKGFF